MTVQMNAGRRYLVSTSSSWFLGICRQRCPDPGKGAQRLPALVQLTPAQHSLVLVPGRLQTAVPGPGKGRATLAGTGAADSRSTQPRPGSGAFADSGARTRERARNACRHWCS